MDDLYDVPAIHTTAYASRCSPWRGRSSRSWRSLTPPRSRPWCGVRRGVADPARYASGRARLTGGGVAAAAGDRLAGWVSGALPGREGVVLLGGPLVFRERAGEGQGVQVASRRRVDDQMAAAYLTRMAVLEIRSMARRRKALESWPDDDYVACIAWLADLVHNIAGGSEPTRRWLPWRGHRRPMYWTWNVAGSAGREWILAALEREVWDWTPPPLKRPADADS